VIRVNDQLVRDFVETYFNRAFGAFVEYQKQLENRLRQAGGLPGLFPPFVPWTGPMFGGFGVGAGAPAAPSPASRTTPAPAGGGPAADHRRPPPPGRRARTARRPRGVAEPGAAATRGLRGMCCANAKIFLDLGPPPRFAVGGQSGCRMGPRVGHDRTQRVVRPPGPGRGPVPKPASGRAEAQSPMGRMPPRRPQTTGVIHAN
jgi:hypothetical protein